MLASVLLSVALLAVVAVSAVGMFILRRRISRVQQQLSAVYHEVRHGLIRRHEPERAAIDVALVFDPPNHLSGFGHQQWTHVAMRLLEGWSRHTDGLRAPFRPPDSRSAGLPALTPYGTLSNDRLSQLEGFSRSLWFAAPLLAANPDLTLHGVRVADYYLEYLLKGVSRYDEASFGVPTGSRPSPLVMEAAAICIALKEARGALWEPLDAADRRRIGAWLSACRRAATNLNNWRWFPVIVNTFLKTEGFESSEAQVKECISDIRAMYRGSGWFLDGSRFDYYASWSMQFYPIFWLRWDDTVAPGLRREFHERNDAFLESFSHLYSREGVLPLWGRSPVYRFGASAALSTAFLRHDTPSLDPGFARRLCSGNILQHVRHSGFLADGVPSLGFHGETPALVDGYSGPVSVYWCAKVFAALYLPPTHPFWASPESEGFWQDPPDSVRIDGPGFRVDHDRTTGHSRLFAAQPCETTDPRYAAESFRTEDALPVLPRAGRRTRPAVPEASREP